MRMGFPQHKILKPEEVSMCLWYYPKFKTKLINNFFKSRSHMETNETRFSNGGYFCPICDSKYCELPIECKVCGKIINQVLINLINFKYVKV